MYIVEPRNHEMQHFVKKKKNPFVIQNNPFVNKLHISFKDFWAFCEQNAFCDMLGANVVSVIHKMKGIYPY